jgi:uncharacterized protein (DUF1501 family)
MSGSFCDNVDSSRRTFLAGAGLGAAALSTMLTEDALADRSTHFSPRARRVIWLFMAGAPSQLDTLDHKPGLQKLFDKDLPDSIRGAQRLTTMTSSQPRFPIAPSVFRFPRHGDCGKPVSELFPRVGSMADELAFVHTIHTDAINHDPAITLIQTGNQTAGHPSLGAWLSYGLGTMNRNLPSFVVLNCEPRGQALYSRLWGSGFLASRHAGVAFRSQGDPVLYLSNPAGVSRDVRRVMIERLRAMNETILARGGDPETQARIAQYEMAFRMQASVPELVDISGESKSTLEMYGEQATQPGTFAANCLLARRMAERDVRFIQVFHRGWDHHGSLPKNIRRQAGEVDQPAWALVQDLKQRGLLDDTLVIWGGEFGRTVYSQGTLTRSDYGRDHHPRCYSMWFAGGGTAGGVSYGRTDDFSYNIVENPVHIRDLNATILHLLGIDHRRLSVKYQGLDHRLTGVLPARVVKPILA